MKKSGTTWESWTSMIPVRVLAQSIVLYNNF